MKPAKKISFPVIAFLLAAGLMIAAYFLFWKKPAKPSLAEFAKSQLKSESATNPAADEAMNPEAEEEETGPPIPYEVHTDAVDKVSDSIQLVHKSHFLPSAPDCENYSVEWTEIKLTDKRVEQRINRSIQDEVQTWQVEDENKPGVPARYCDTKSDFEFTGLLKIYGNLAHAYFNHYIYEAGGAHPNTMVKTYCYSLKTGKTVNFHDLIHPEKIAELDSLIVQHYDGEEGPWAAELRRSYRQQLLNLNFTFGETGLEIIRRGYNYATSIMPLNLNRNQTATYLKPEVYKMVYGKENAALH